MSEDRFTESLSQLPSVFGESTEDALRERQEPESRAASDLAPGSSRYRIVAQCTAPEHSGQLC